MEEEEYQAIANFIAFQKLPIDEECNDTQKRKKRKDAIVKRCKDFVYRDDLLFYAPSSEKSASCSQNITDNRVKTSESVSCTQNITSKGASHSVIPSLTSVGDWAVM